MFGLEQDTENFFRERSEVIKVAVVTDILAKHLK